MRRVEKIFPGISQSLTLESMGTLLSLPASILVNRTLGAEDRGLLAITILVPSTIIVIGSCQWDKILQGLVTSKKISTHEAWTLSIKYAYILSIIFIPIGVFVSLNFTKISFEYRLLSLVMYAAFPVCFLWNCLSGIFISSGNIRGQYFISLSLKLSFLLFVAFLFLTKTVSITSMVIVSTALHFTAFFSALAHAKKSMLMDKKEGEIAANSSLLVKSFIPYAIESLSSKIDVWSLSFFGSLYSVGCYSAIVALMLPFSLASNSMISASTATLDWQEFEKVKSYLKKVFIALAIILILSMLIIESSKYYLLNFILGKTFEKGFWMLPWIVLMVVAQSCALQLHTAIRLSGLLDGYLLIQTIEPFIRGALIITLALHFSELGIMVGLLGASIIKIFICTFYLYKPREVNV